MTYETPIQVAPTSSDTATDATLVARSLVEPEAFVELFDRHFATVHRYLHRRLGRDLADDLAAETFVRAFAGRRSFEPRSDTALPWLFGIAGNLARRQRRSEERRLRAYARTGRDETTEIDETAVVDRVAAGRDGPALAGALASLSVDEREALLLVALSDLTHEEAAEALGVPVGTVASRLHRARSRVRASLASHQPENPGGTP